MLIDMRRVRPVPDLLAFARDNGLAITMDAVMGQRCQEIVDLGHDGLLGPDLTLIHCNDMPEEGWRLIAEAGTKVTLATTSEQQLGLGSGVPVIQDAVRAEVGEENFRAVDPGESHASLFVVKDLDRSRVLFVAEHRTTGSLDEFWSSLTAEQIEAVQAVAMDMWEPYVTSTLNHLPEGQSKIAFDKFDIAKHLSEAVDQVRRRENKQLRAQGDDRLTGTRYDWLRNPARMEPEYRYDARPDRNEQLREALLEEARQNPRFGYRRLWVVLTKKRGMKVDVKRVHRLYRQEGLAVRRLKRVIEQRGQPKSLRCDNGPEFTSRHLLGWCEDKGIQLVHTQPRRPMQNGHVESFNGKLRDECLNANWFLNLADARRRIEHWRVEYNSERPHSGRKKKTGAGDGSRIR